MDGFANHKPDDADGFAQRQGGEREWRRHLNRPDLLQDGQTPSVAFLTTQKKLMQHQQCLLEQGHLLHDISQYVQLSSTLQEQEQAYHAYAQALERYQMLVQEQETLLQAHQQVVQELLRTFPRILQRAGKTER